MSKEKTIKIVVDNHNPAVSVQSSTYGGRAENVLYLECPIELGQDIQKKQNIPDLDRATIQDIMVRGMCQLVGIEPKPSYFDRWFYKPKAEKKVTTPAQNVSTVTPGVVQQAPAQALADKAYIEAVKQKIAGKNVTPEVLKNFLAKAFPTDAGLQTRIYTALMPQAPVEIALPEL